MEDINIDNIYDKTFDIGDMFLIVIDNIESIANVKNLKINSNNLLFEYCSHTLKNTKDMYLYYFGEHNIAYTKYDIVLDIFKRDLLDTYVNANIKKELEKKEISFQLKPLVYELHGIYLKTHKKINSRKVEEYIMSMEPDRLTFILKYYL